MLRSGHSLQFSASPTLWPHMRLGKNWIEIYAHLTLRSRHSFQNNSENNGLLMRTRLMARPYMYLKAVDTI